MTHPDGTFDVRPGSAAQHRRGRRRVRLLTAGLATAAVAGTGILAAELAPQAGASASTGTGTGTGTSSGDSISSSASGLGSTSGSGSAHASSGGS